MVPPFRTALRVALAGLVATASLLVPAATAGADDAPQPAGQLDLPPSARDELAKIFDPQLKKLGLRTTRAGLQDLEEYRESPTGTHLAYYVEPIDADGVDDDFYLDRIAATAKVFLPRVFKEWINLESFDVCLEPVESPSPSPPPVSQLQVDRETSKDIRWRRADLAALVGEAAERSQGSSESGDRESFFLYISPRLRDAEQFEDARVEAGLPADTDATSGPPTP